MGGDGIGGGADGVVVAPLTMGWRMLGAWCCGLRWWWW